MNCSRISARPFGRRLPSGIYADGVALHTSAGPNATLTSTVDYLFVRVIPSITQTAGVNINAFTPPSIVRAFGAPDDAFLLYSSSPLRSYQLLFLYGAQGVVYVIRGAFQGDQLCLTPDSIENITLYRFPNAAAAQGFLRLASGGVDGPQSIGVTTKQSARDLTGTAQSPTTNCLILK
jgi:hypothetical protein